MVYASTMEHPPNSQYDPDSAPEQSRNCGPTTVTNVVKFMRDIDYGIQATRRLGTSRVGTGTNVSERKRMLDRRGVPSSVHRWSAAQVKAALNGRRTLDLALLMSRIPLSIRKRPFSGGHSVEALAVGVRSGESGIWVNNPDFRRELDPPRYFYPDRYWILAYEALGRFCVVPDKDKVIPTRVSYRRSCRTTAALNVRSGPGTQYSRVRTMASGFAFTSIQLENAGGAYVAGAVRRDWLSFSLEGRLAWVARAWVREV